ncbi:class V aminotransferase [Nocardiopsis sp. CNR-923]|uniref:aminotransferase class V-fold PLP-dependent enzyme n=1 Tax=Nocardiopsis sp. CNR-923 TaxID=1904965 RepID=UPI000965D722|nr:aminotransferase class V-fold PLP-dependent enzyme [Nocardiopsis sp. CNR-923]OLT29654.1 class V aminotransferase [Nocardiopsis sp. CNR-923]
MDDISRARLHAARQQFSPEVTYLNTATHGLPPLLARQALERYIHDASAGRFQPSDSDDVVASARSAYARLVGVPAERIAVGTHVSQFTGTIAASLPAGSEVLVARNEFTSVVFPFMSREADGLRVREVPLDRLPDEVGPNTSLVAVAAVQSATGAIAPVQDLITACADNGARLMLDTTQSFGWLPVPADRVDLTVCSTYKWALGPRGAAFLTGTSEALAALRPLAPNWFAGTDPWSSLYGGPLRLSDAPRRLDLAPVWPAWYGLLPALELIEEVGVQTIREHDTALANRLRTAMDLEPAGSAIVSLEVSEEAARRAARAGIATSARAGRMRASFHLYNDEDDVDRLVKALT